MAPRKKTPTKPELHANGGPEAPAPATDRPSERPANGSTIQVGALFWGLLFVMLGALFFLQNFDIVTVDFSNVIRLWPLLVILFGLSLLSSRGTIWRVATIVFSVVAVGVVAAAATGQWGVDRDDRGREMSETVERAADDVRTVDVTIKTGAGEFALGAHGDDEVVKTELESDVATLRQTSRQENDKQTIEIVTEPFGQWRVGDVRNDLSVTFNEQLAYAATLEIGAARAAIDATDILLTDLKMKVGASSTSLRLGERADALTASVEAGASAVVIEVPSASGVRLTLESGLADINLGDLDSKGDGIYESPGYDGADKKIHLTVKVGAGSLKLVRY